MMSNNSVKPLELVVSAIHCLREKNGSSPQNILRYLAGKYNVNTEVLKPYVKTGLKRGVSFGLITQQSGLYRLNDILSAPLDYPAAKKEKPQRTKQNKAGGLLRKGKCRQNGRKRRRRRGGDLLKPPGSILQRKRKTKRSKEGVSKRKKTGLTSRRYNNERRRKQKRQKTRGKKRLRPKSEKLKKGRPEIQKIKPETAENQMCQSAKEIEATKDIVKT